MTYREFCNLKSNDPKENIFPKGTEPEEAMEILEETFIYHDDHDLCHGHGQCPGQDGCPDESGRRHGQQDQFRAEAGGRHDADLLCVRRDRLHAVHVPCRHRQGDESDL